MKIFTFLILLTFTLNANTNNIAGTWKGVGKQDNGSRWSIKMSIGNTYSIEYPSIPCSGSLTLLSHKGNEYIFREKITKHKKNCINNGKLKVTKLTANSLKWQWYYPNGKKGGFATVKRSSSSKKSFLTSKKVVTNKMGIVTGLDPNGEGFLSIRKKPKGRKIGKLYNGDKVKILDKSGKWYKVKHVSSGKIGWSHSNWVKTQNSKQRKSTQMTSDQLAGQVAVGFVKWMFSGSGSSGSYTSSGNSAGSKEFTCTYKCRTDGAAVYDTTDKFTLKISADKQYQAQSKAENIAKKQCKSMRGPNSGDSMWSTSIRCEQNF